MDNKPTKTMKIDVDAVLRSRLPRHYRFIPRWLVRWIEEQICQDEMNDILRRNADKRDAEFCRGVIEALDIKYDVEGRDILERYVGKRPVLVSNHPLGGLDGIIYIDMLSRVFGPNIHFMVNDLLLAIEPLRGVFLPINKHGSQSRQSHEAVERAFESDAPIVIFPAGLVSRKGADGKICDLEWKKMFVNKCRKYHRDVIPMYFDGENSRFFYNFARMRSRSGLKFNIEMVRLPKEMFLSRGKHFDILVGEPIAWSDLKGGKDSEAQALEIKRIVYNLKETLKKHE